MFLLLLGACGPIDSKIPDIPDEDTAVEDTGELPPLEHCGAITADETWKAKRAHLVTCDVEVEQGTLTVEPGASVTFAENTGLSIGTADYEASFLVDGTSSGVVFSPDGDFTWDGITVGDTAKNVAISGLSVKGTTAGVRIVGAEVTLGSLSIDGASEGCGLTMDEGAQFADGATGLTVTGAASWGVCGEVRSAASLPASASRYTGNASDGVYLTGSQLNEPATWENLGVPYVIAENVDVAGTADAPAVLTFTEGTTVRFERDRALRFSRLGDASQLVAIGSADAPVTFDALGADIAGYWHGLEVDRGADEVRLSHVVITGAGGAGAALTINDTPVWLDDLSITGSEGAGVELRGSAVFAAGSAGLSVSDSGLPVVLPAAGVPSLPTTGANFTGNTVNAVKVSGDAAVSASGTWPDPGVPYWLVDDVAVDGKADAPAIVTLSAGVDLLLDNNVGLYVGRNGAAGFVVDGTAAAPVTMEPWSANTPGAWGGLGLYENAVAGGSRLAHLTIGYAGGTTLKGNLHLSDASPVLDTVYLHDGEEWGLYLNGDSAPELTGVSYANNGLGTCNACN